MSLVVSELGDNRWLSHKGSQVDPEDAVLMEEWEIICPKVCTYCSLVMTRRVSALCFSECHWQGPNAQICWTFYMHGLEYGLLSFTPH